WKACVSRGRPAPRRIRTDRITPSSSATRRPRLPGSLSRCSWRTRATGAPRPRRSRRRCSRHSSTPRPPRASGWWRLADDGQRAHHERRRPTALLRDGPARLDRHRIRLQRHRDGQGLGRARALLEATDLARHRPRWQRRDRGRALSHLHGEVGVAPLRTRGGPPRADALHRPRRTRRPAVAGLGVDQIPALRVGEDRHRDPAREYPLGSKARSDTAPVAGGPAAGRQRSAPPRASSARSRHLAHVHHDLLLDAVLGRAAASLPLPASHADDQRRHLVLPAGLDRVRRHPRLRALSVAATARAHPRRRRDQSGRRHRDAAGLEPPGALSATAHLDLPRPRRGSLRRGIADHSVEDRDRVRTGRGEGVPERHPEGARVPAGTAHGLHLFGRGRRDRMSRRGRRHRALSRADPPRPQDRPPRPKPIRGAPGHWLDVGVSVPCARERLHDRRARARHRAAAAAPELRRHLAPDELPPGRADPERRDALAGVLTGPMHPTIVQFGNFAIHSYGLLLAVAFLVSIQIFLARGKARGIPEERLSTLSLLLLLLAIIGGRALFVFTHWADYAQDPLGIFRLWEGGLMLYGGYFLAISGGIVYVRRAGLPVWRIADAAAPSMAIGVGIGRLGCFFNGCCFGLPTH